MAWHAKNYGGYYNNDQDAIDNGLEFVTGMLSVGWTKEAAAAAWGNIGFESAYNPWRWERDNILPSYSSVIDTSRTNGYGLVQFTPPGNYLHNSYAQSLPGFAPNYSDRTGNASDGAAQTVFIDWFGGQGQWFINPGYNYPLSWSQFKESTLSPEYLAAAWLHNYERPADQSHSVEVIRGQEARYWYDLWGGVVPPGPTFESKYKFWLYGRNWTRRQRR